MATTNEEAVSRKGAKENINVFLCAFAPLRENFPLKNNNAEEE